MDTDYARILRKHRFYAVPEPEDTALAFYHEINNTLFSGRSPFDLARSSVTQAPRCLEQMVDCFLALKPGRALTEGVSYLMTAWYESLTYCDVLNETIQRTATDKGVEVRVLAISSKTACSLRFVIGAYSSGPLTDRDQMMSKFKRVVHCGIDFNLMERGDREYREECLKEWLNKNCTSSCRYEWSSADEFAVYFEDAEDFEKSVVLIDGGIPHKSTP